MSKPTATITVFPYNRRSNGLTRPERIEIATACAEEIEAAIRSVNNRYVGSDVRVELPEAITVDRETFLWSQLTALKLEGVLKLVRPSE